MKKYKRFYDFEEEEQFLNDMAKQGYRFTKKTLFDGYVFQEAEPEHLTYKIDYRPFYGKHQFNEYINFFEDSGWKHVWGSIWSGSQYFLPLSEKAQTDGLFSDEESSIARYKRLLQNFYPLILIFMLNLFRYFPQGAFIISEKSWYFTRRFFEKGSLGAQISFIIETPFVIFYFLLPLILLIATIYSTYCIIRVKQSMRKYEV